MRRLDLVGGCDLINIHEIGRHHSMACSETGGVPNLFCQLSTSKIFQLVYSPSF